MKEQIIQKGDIFGEELKHHILRRLSEIIVGKETNITSSILEFLIEQTLLEKSEKVMISREKIALGIKEIFLLKFSIEELEEPLQNLITAGRVKASNKIFCLVIDRFGELKKRNAETKRFEKQILNEWWDKISIQYPEIGSKFKEDLTGDLQLYLNKIFLKHGAECAGLIYPKDSKLDEYIRLLLTEEEFEKCLPKRSAEIERVRKIEFPLFLRNIDSKKKKYLSQLLDGTFIYRIVQADPQTKKYIATSFKSYSLYLDTNVLYSLFDLSVRNKTTVERTIDLAREFGMKILVSKRTVEEMKKSVESNGASLLKSPDIRRDLAEIAADISEEENFITAYRREYYRTGINKTDFINKFTHVSELLKNKGIEIDTRIINFSKETIEKETRILNDNIRIKKDLDVAQHDAYSCLLIRRLRKETEANQSEGRYWFLTLDYQLLIYGAKTKDAGEPSFSLLPHQLLQLLRPFTQRTEEYDSDFIELFSRPQIKSAQGILPNNLAEKIMAKISSFKEVRPDIALSIILNAEFIKAVSTEKDPVKIEEETAKQIGDRLAIRLSQVEDRLRHMELQKTPAPQTVRSLSTSNYWNLVNPLWLVWQLLKWFYNLIKKHKLISGLIVFMGLIATDYSMAWQNLKTIWRFIKNAIGL
ncbi:MAG: hypothetical protein A2401_01350 [Candidatus Staskawiczbacteria bacterium RIFOXYC1_FULL_38_18]|uniref:PIN domain-containing protein n=1 Tax=Candidatus Staskawiczbacteria bacterium RIFOXYC1_FULL_38_18 TaxID=1802229 RepID=A0A1G2JC05_9BACT|nr:MAG: hypothetical protein A2401_01350 [Candidatus Staskawiczbacteria bacterium RIFOXYC1_FULL_38_18]